MKIIITLALITVVLLQGQWFYDTVQTGIQNFSKSYIALDLSGNPCIAYLPSYTNYLRYAKKTGSVWSITTVANDAYTTAGGPTLALSLSFNQQGYPYITYSTGVEVSQRLKLAYYNGSIWDTMNIDGPQVPKASLAFDTLNNPVVGYQYNYYQKFASYQGGSWIFDSIGPIASPVGKVSLIRDTLNNYHYVYDGIIIHAYGVPSNWNVDTIDASSGGWTSMVLDNNNLLHICYTKPFNTNLWYAYFNGANWIQSFVDSGWGSGPRLVAPSIGIDARGYIYIAYLHQTSTSGIYRLKFGYYDGSAWNFEVVDSGFAWHVPSLTVASNGSPHIAYFNGSALLHAYRDPIGISEDSKQLKNERVKKKFIASPNPFVYSTKIQDAGQEDFLVYDITGRMVGRHKGDQIGIGLPSGIYFIVPESRNAKPLMVLKIQ